MDNNKLGLGAAQAVRELGTDDIKAVAQGACFLASGGGGSLQLALTKIIPAFFSPETKIPMVGIDDLNWEGDWGAVVAGMGSPLKMFEDPSLIGKTVPAYSKLAELAHAFKKGGEERFASLEAMVFCLPVEIGAVNSIVPMIVADALPPVMYPWYIPMSVVDADGAGRAVPTLPLTTYARQVALYPNVLGGDNNTEPKSEYFDYASLNVQDETTLETACLGLIDSKAFGDVSGLSIYTASGPTFQGCSPVPGGISDALAIGRIIETAAGQERINKIVDYINTTMKRVAKEIFYGEVAEMKEATSSLDDGYVMITGGESFAGQTLKLYIQNENIWGEITKEGKTTPYIMGPDSMNYLTQSGDVVDNSDLWKLYETGERPILGIVAIQAAPQVLENKGLLRAWEQEVGEQKGPSSYSSPWMQA